MTRLATRTETAGPDWGALEARLRPFLTRRLPTPADVDDVLQDVLLRVLRGLPELSEETRLAAWMVQIARNAVVDFYRQRRAAPTPLLTEPVAEGDRLEDAEEQERARLERMLAAYVGFVAEQLPEPYREAIRLTELEGRTQREAARLVGVPLSTMKSRVQRGRERIRGELDACCRVGLDARGRLQSCEPKAAACSPGGCGVSERT